MDRSTAKTLKIAVVDCSTLVLMDVVWLRCQAPAWLMSQCTAELLNDTMVAATLQQPFSII